MSANPTDGSAVQQETSSNLAPEIRARLQKCFEYGNKKMQAGEHDYATEMFVQCVTGDPGNLIYLQTFLANLRVKYGNNKKGVSFGFIRGGGAAKGSIKAAEVRKKWDDVIKAGCEALRTNPWDDAVLFAMGKACLTTGWFDTGLAYLKHAVEANPDDLELNRFAAVELGKRQMYEHAIACWQRILNKKPEDQQAKRGITDLLLERTIKKVDHATATKAAQQLAVDEGEEDTMSKVNPEEKLEKRLAKDPGNRAIYDEMYEYFLQRASYKKAEDITRRALATFPGDDVYTYRLAEIGLTRAKELLEQTKKLYEKDPQEQLREQFNKQKAEFEAKRLDLVKLKLEENPQNNQARFEYANYLMKSGQHKEAINEFQTAKVDVTIKGDCLLALAWCFQQIKQFRLAMMHYEQALESLTGEGDHVKQALYQAARLAYHLEDCKKADELAHRLAAIDFSYKDLGDLLDKIAKKGNNE